MCGEALIAACALQNLRQFLSVLVCFVAMCVVAACSSCISEHCLAHVSERHVWATRPKEHKPASSAWPVLIRSRGVMPHFGNRAQDPQEHLFRANIPSC